MGGPQRLPSGASITRPGASWGSVPSRPWVRDEDQELKPRVGSAGGDGEHSLGGQQPPPPPNAPLTPRGALDAVTAFTCLVGCGRLFGYRC